MERYLQLEEVSQATGIPINTLRFWRAQGRGGPQSAKFGRRVVYRASDLDAWIEAQFNAEVQGSRAQ